MSGQIGGWHCTACHQTFPGSALSALSGTCSRSADGEHLLYVQLGQGYPNGWDGAPCTCVRPAAGAAIVIVGASFDPAASARILAALAVIWLGLWLASRMLREERAYRAHRAEMRRTLARALDRRDRGNPR